MIALLDTNVLIAHASDAETTPDLSMYSEFAVSSLSWAELVKGLHATTDISLYKQRVARYDMLRDLFGAGIAYDDSCVDAYDRVMRHVTAQGANPRQHVTDRMIAATALAHELTLVSADRSGFVGLEGLVQIDIR